MALLRQINLKGGSAGRRRTISSLLLAAPFLIAPLNGQAQQRNNEIFEGGVSDGSAVSCFAQKDRMRDGNNRIFGGGSADGWSVSCYVQKDRIRDGNNRIFGGGLSDGWGRSCYGQNFPKQKKGSNIFEGGAHDGASYDCYEQEDDPNPLPVGLIRFGSECLEGKAILSWKTATETRNKKFLVQGSHDGEELEKLGEVKGAMNSVETNSYRFTLKDGGSDHKFLRLAMVDVNGERSFSQFIHREKCNNGPKDRNIDLFPNPAGSKISIKTNFDKREIRRTEIFTARGKLKSEKGSGQTDLALEGLSSGVYYLKVHTKSKVFTKKFVIE